MATIEYMIKLYRRSNSNVYAVVYLIKLYMLLGEFDETQAQKYYDEINFTEQLSTFELLKKIAPLFKTEQLLERAKLEDAIWVWKDYAGEITESQAQELIILAS